MKISVFLFNFSDEKIKSLAVPRIQNTHGNYPIAWFKFELNNFNKILIINMNACKYQKK